MSDPPLSRLQTLLLHALINQSCSRMRERKRQRLPTALHAMLRHDGKLCCFSKSSDDTTLATHGACEGTTESCRSAPELGVVAEHISKSLARVA